MGVDFYPTNMEGKATWHANFDANIPAFLTKYNITTPQHDQLKEDNNWIQFWVPRRLALAAFSSQMSAYFNSIAGNDPSLDPPETPVYSNGTPPAEVPPGIEFRVREIARHIKGHSSYAEADGILLGIVGESSGQQGIGQAQQPTIQCFPALSDYEFAIVVTGRGQADSWEVQASVVGSGTWQTIATATGKSANIQWSPGGDVPAPVTLFVRVQLRKNNEDYGEVSAPVQVTLTP